MSHKEHKDRRDGWWIRVAVCALAICFIGGVARAADQTPEDLLREAQQLEQQGKPEQAVARYKDFVQKYPDHSQLIDAHYHLAKCYDTLGMVDECMASLKVVTTSDKKQYKSRPDALYMLGKLYHSLKKYDEAIKTFEQLLAEGAGMYTDEVLNLTAGFYAIQQKYDDAAAKFNLLKRRENSKLAEQAAYKLCLLWLKAEKMDQAVDAIQDLVQLFPANKQIPELLLKAADVYRQQKKFDKTISLCEQLKQRYPKALETLGASYILGLCYADRKEFDKAASVLDQVGKVKEFQGRGLAAEALLQAAEIYNRDLGDVQKAVPRWEEAAKLARDSDSERKTAILEQCYFRLAEYQFQQKKWSAALDYYVMLRNLGTKINIFERIAKCQAELGITDAAETLNEADIELLKKKIAENPGKSVAAEAEVMILDRKLKDAAARGGNTAALAVEYEKVLGAYPKEALSREHLMGYIYGQMGACHARGATRDDLAKAIAAFEKVPPAEGDENSPFSIAALENVAAIAERMGDQDRVARTYAELFRITKKRYDANKDDKEAEKKTLEYLKGLVTRTQSENLIQDSIDLCDKIIQEKGPLSELAREARFYKAELFYVKRRFSDAAKTYKEFVQIYGPKQDAEGDVAGGPWKPQTVDDKVKQVYEAAVRIAHCWHMQGHDQNTIAAYQWIVKNLPTGNKYMAEAQYWLAEEIGKKEQEPTKETKKKMAQAMWQGVISPTLEFGDVKGKNTFHPWVRDGDPDVQQYVKNAMLRAGQLFGEADDHQSAASVFETYLALNPTREKPSKRASSGTAPDDMYDIARYALGREYIALKNLTKMFNTYKPYLTGARDDRFRVSGVKLMGYYALEAEQYDIAMDAYATLLDEYGETRQDGRGNVIPVPQKDRLRGSKAGGWDGIRMAPPKDLDLGEIRYQLGYMYWRGSQWALCAKTLAPFSDDTQLAANKSRSKALYMAGQCYYKAYDYAAGVKVIHALVRDYPKFEGIEEAYMNCAKGFFETRAYGDLDVICQKFAREWPKSYWRPRMDFYAAMSAIGQRDKTKGLSGLKTVAASDAPQDVRADALRYIAVDQAALPATQQEAMKNFETSISTHATEGALLDGAKLAMKMKQWSQAKDWLERIGRDFLSGRPEIVSEAKDLLPTVQKEIVKKP